MLSVKRFTTLLSIFFVVLIGVNVVYTLSGVRSFGVSSIDSTAIWLFKAKATWLEGGLPWQTLRKPELAYQHPQYPVLLPSLTSLSFTLFGESGDQVALLFYPVMYVTVLALCYLVLWQLKLPIPVALGATYFYSMFSPLLAAAGRRHAGEADIIVTLIAWVILALIQTLQKNPRYILRISWSITLLIMLASQVKMEGLFLALVLIFLPTSRSTKLIQLLASSLPFIVWSIVVHLTNLPSDFGFIFPGPALFLSRTIEITFGVVRETLQFNQWYLFWPVFGLAISVWPSHLLWVKKTVVPTTLGMCSLFLLTYLCTSLNTTDHLISSLDRVMLQLSPWLYIILCERLQNKVKLWSRAEQHV